MPEINPEIEIAANLEIVPEIISISISHKDNPLSAVKATTDKPSDLYVAVGSALTFWEALQDLLINLYKLFCCNPDEAFSVVEQTKKYTNFLKTKNYGSRLKMLHTAVHRDRTILTEKEKRETEVLLSTVNKHFKTRTDIAHGCVLKLHVTLGNEQTVLDGNYLVPSLTKNDTPINRSMMKILSKTYTAEEINYWRESIRDLRAELTIVLANAEKRYLNTIYPDRET